MHYGCVLSSAFLHPCHRSLTAAAGFALGDIVAQHSTKHPGERYNYLRTARMTAFGLFFAGPLQGHYWYGWLDKVSLRLEHCQGKDIQAKFLMCFLILLYETLMFVS